jgi:transcriptional regulator with XRE-family HTH domain
MSFKAGQELRKRREDLGLTLRDVENASAAIAAKYGNPEFNLPFSRLSEIETKGIIPSIFRIYALAAIYHHDYREICAWYGVDWNGLPADTEVALVPKTHRFTAITTAMSIKVPVAFDPGFDVRRTTNLARMIQKWGSVPAAFLHGFVDSPHTYAFVGTEDFTMYPIVLPGSFLQIDETKSKVVNEGWRSEYERPIYFIETREEFICSWCNLNQHGQLVLQPHPLSPAVPRVFRHPQDAEIIGQVVAVAMRLDEWLPQPPIPQKKSLNLN